MTVQRMSEVFLFQIGVTESTNNVTVTSPPHSCVLSLAKRFCLLLQSELGKKTPEEASYYKS